MKTNAELQRDVQDAINWEPQLKNINIGITATDGIVCLTGTVDNYAKKIQIEQVVKKVFGVNIFVENIDVKLQKHETKNDIEIAKEIMAAFEANPVIPQEQLEVKVENGWVTLTGELSWDYLRDVTENTIQHLPWIKGIYNNITIVPEMHHYTIDKKDIMKALKRSSIDDREITVSVSGTTVRLTGTVHTWHQREEAARIVWKTPGIKNLKNELKVDYEYDL
ncbi:BON domain-containing protein [Epilithonimonas hungarica]|uniref:Osmotically-inducible protein OsmY, contains BON domain n=1 Tax=Epilithonimonas hungarica TaxID=454006 RepID=A0A1G7R2W9_9FLAO|nr:BON domain-containing protein [Epilithonimonas hungarica]SDG04300.1 Osmotically-inducible protein OsmY, contains BON domain [Epilithonimonas hungarica]